MAVAPDDSIYLLGVEPASGGGYVPIVAHYTPDGLLDQSFANGGVARLSITVSGGLLHLVLQPNGGIIVTASPWYLFRLTPSGSLDPAFGSGGVVSYTSNAVAGLDGPTAVAVGSDNKIVTAGAPVYSSQPINGALVRFDSTGHVDPTFGANGVVTDPLGAAPPWSVAVGLDDYVTVAGPDGSQGVITRYDADGTIRDPSFNSGSIQSVMFGDLFPSLVLTPTGLIGTGTHVVSGDMDSNTYYRQPFLIGLTTSGSPDTGFGPVGALLESDSGWGTGIVAQPDGKFIQAGVFETARSAPTATEVVTCAGAHVYAAVHCAGGPDTPCWSVLQTVSVGAQKGRAGGSDTPGWSVLHTVSVGTHNGRAGGSDTPAWSVLHTVSVGTQNGLADESRACRLRDGREGRRCDHKSAGQPAAAHINPRHGFTSPGSLRRLAPRTYEQTELKSSAGPPTLDPDRCLSWAFTHARRSRSAPRYATVRRAASVPHP